MLCAAGTALAQLDNDDQRSPSPGTAETPAAPTLMIDGHRTTLVLATLPAAATTATTDPVRAMNTDHAKPGSAAWCTMNGNPKPTCK